MAIIIDEIDLERQIAEAAALKNLSVQEYAREVLRASLPAAANTAITMTERQQRVIAGRGALVGIGLSSERFMAEKAEEKEREEHPSKATAAQAAREQRKQAALARFRNGEYADLATSSDDFAARKAEEIELEESRWSTSLDACALLALIRAEPGSDFVSRLVATEVCLVHAVNRCEVFYDVLRDSDLARAREVIQRFADAGIVTRRDTNAAFLERVGRLKVTPGRLSLGDCFGFALAQQEAAPFVTSDHHEFDRIVALGYGPILFIR